MTLRDKIRANAAPLLAPGEEIQAVIPAQTVTQYLLYISTLIITATHAQRVIVVTDRRILLCRGGRFRQSPVGEVLAELPRQTLIGPAHGLWYRTDTLGQRLYIQYRFHKDVTAADQGASARTSDSGAYSAATDPVRDADSQRIDVTQTTERAPGPDGD